MLFALKLQNTKNFLFVTFLCEPDALLLRYNYKNFA